MPRGRHRNSTLHRVLIPVSLGGAAAACAGLALLADEPLVLRCLAGGAALPALAGAVLLWHWDLKTGHVLARESAAKAGLTWRLEERHAELEAAGERVAALEESARATRAELRRLRGEHAALLRRYATAESERAKALESRRQLAIEAATPAKALPARATDHRTAAGAPTRLTYAQAHEALIRLSRNAAQQREVPRQRSGGFDFFRATSRSGHTASH